jgi:hypothetical protein
MLISLDWFGCTPNSTIEIQIHQILQGLSEVKAINRASLRIEQNATSPEPFHLTLMLSMPGPDVLASAQGTGLQETLFQLTASTRKKLAAQLAGNLQPVRPNLSLTLMAVLAGATVGWACLSNA